MQSATEFDKKMARSLSYLKASTKLTNYRRKAIKEIKGLLK